MEQLIKDSVNKKLQEINIIKINHIDVFDYSTWFVADGDIKYSLNNESDLTTFSASIKNSRRNQYEVQTVQYLLMTYGLGKV